MQILLRGCTLIVLKALAATRATVRVGVGSCDLLRSERARLHVCCDLFVCAALSWVTRDISDLFPIHWQALKTIGACLKGCNVGIIGFTFRLRSSCTVPSVCDPQLMVHEGSCPLRGLRGHLHCTLNAPACISIIMQSSGTIFSMRIPSGCFVFVWLVSCR